MGSVPHPDLNEIPRVALYARVSTEDQAERQTVQGQLDFLRKLAELHGWPVAGEYVDDGVSGTVPLDQRTDGRRLLDDARIRRFEMVVFYRLDRLGRSIRVLLDAHQALEDSGILLKSATEPFDTASPIGKFVFALLGGMAELEKATIVERTTMGRDRVAKAGKWTGGPIPFGYDVDGEGCLVPSARLVLSLDTTEAELAADLYKRIAAGSTLVRECTRLTALGVPAATRYAGGGTARVCDQWRPSRLSKMLRNPVYKGEHVLRSRRGDVARPAPALVSAELWERVQKQLAHNRTMSVKPASRPYLLRGLITCEACGQHYSGATATPNGRTHAYYRCNAQSAASRLDPAQRCIGKALPADWLEQTVWDDCRYWIFHPGEAIAEAEQALQARAEQNAGLDHERQALLRHMAEKDAERERILTLYRRNRLSITEVEHQLDAIAGECDQLRQLVQALDSQSALADAYQTHVTEAAAVLTQLQERIEEVERTNDWQKKQEIMALLVAGIRVQTEGEGRRKRAHVRMHYTFGQPVAVDSLTGGRAQTAPAGRFRRLPRPSPPVAARCRAGER
jgi:site-specific DNA recombinase